jgi:hypothetical protein
VLTAVWNRERKREEVGLAEREEIHPKGRNGTGSLLSSHSSHISHDFRSVGHAVLYTLCLMKYNDQIL